MTIAKHLPAFTKLAFAFTLALSACFPINTSAENAKASDGKSFTELCPTLLKIVDDFGRECITNARTRSYEAPTDLAGHMITVSGTVYFRPTSPESHFSLGCVLNNKDRTKINFIGVYYSTKGSNFNIANTDKAEWRNIDWYGNVGLIADGEPMNFVFVRPFVNDSLPLHLGQGSWLSNLLRNNRTKNCDNATLPNGATTDKFTHIERFEKDGRITIKSCYGPGCDFSQFKDYANYFKSIKKHYVIIGEDSFNEPVDFTRFFEGKDHQIIYANRGFLVESDGALLMRNDILQGDCAGFNYLMRGSRIGNFTIPDIGREVCKLLH